MNGWTLLYKTVERDIETKSDVLITVAHWQLLRIGMKCIGLGDDKTLSESDEESELLPDGWNINKTSYALRYIYENQVFILLGTCVEDTIVLNFLNGKSLEVTNATFVLEQTVATTKGQLNALVPEIDAVINRLQKELLQPVISSNKRTSQTQTEVKPSLPIPFHPLKIGSSLLHHDFRNDLYGIGRNDIDPLGRGGGGMLFDPPGLRNPHPFGGLGGLPGTLPGARFDPLNPPEVERQRRRNSRDFDHFRPPGGSGSSFYGDMFQ